MLAGQPAAVMQVITAQRSLHGCLSAEARQILLKSQSLDLQFAFQVQGYFLVLILEVDPTLQKTRTISKTGL